MLQLDYKFLESVKISLNEKVPMSKYLTGVALIAAAFSFPLLLSPVACPATKSSENP